MAINKFDGRSHHDLDDVREALGLGPQVPLITCDARDRKSSVQALRELVTYTLSLAEVRATVGTS